MYSRYKISLVAQTVKRVPTMRETWVRSLGQEDPLEKEMAIHSSTLCKESDMTEQLHSLTHSVDIKRKESGISS